MQPEIEAKFLNINSDEIRAKLRAIGAKLVYSERSMRRKVFDFPDFRLDGDYSWLRLRDEGDKITLTMKKWTKEGVEGMNELSIIVNDFEETERLLLAIGMMVKSSQVTKRELWKLGDVEVALDTWPWIPTFLEIEGPSEEDVQRVADELGFDWGQAVFGGVARIYKKYFDIEYEEIDRCKEIMFSPVPQWLETKRIVGTIR